MTTEIPEKKSIKELAIETLAIAECNLLDALKSIRPEDVHQQIFPDINPIIWIFGHCAAHMDKVFGVWCQGTQVLMESQQAFYRFGAVKEEIKAGLPASFRELVDAYLSISNSCFHYLNQLSEDEFHNVPSNYPEEPENESHFQLIQRISLHYMGHMGQILTIRRALGNPGPSFVSGMFKEYREKQVTAWKEWWEANKVQFP